MFGEPTKIVNLVGPSGSGKTTLIDRLIKSEEFRILRSITTRPPRATDIDGEYVYLPLARYEKLFQRAHTLLWDTITGDGDHYAKDLCDVIEAVTDPNHTYVHALTPEKATVLAQRYGAPLVRTVVLQPLDTNILFQRMLQRGDNPNTAHLRATQDQTVDWEAIAEEIPGAHLLVNQDLEVRFEEVCSIVSLDR